MAKTKFTTGNKLQNFLAGEEKLSGLSRESLAELYDELADEPDTHWLKKKVLAELEKRIAD